MKRFLFSAMLFSLMVVGAQAQSSSCSKKCTAKQASSKSCEGKSASTASASTIDAAAKLASMDESIVANTCPVTGKVSYAKKETAKNGEISYVDVSYDAETNTFVNASPMKTSEAKASSCSGKSASAKGCCAGKSASSAKGCCSGKSAKSASSTSGVDNSTKETTKPVKG